MIVFVLWCSVLISSVQAEKWDSFKGLWRSFDAQTGLWVFTAEIYEKQGKLNARVIELPGNASLKYCGNCKPPMKNKPLLGMDIIWDLDFEDDRLEHGKILDPCTGSVYDCSLWIGKGGNLHVRGYFKLKAFGKTQIWQAIKSHE
ncbi:MAG: DUF2147 domain-containing protein [Saprospiraceae bacterium]|nr:DUF2147 domain-containing protein [Saprospiraceae bacterium]